MPRPNTYLPPRPRTRPPTSALTSLGRDQPLPASSAIPGCPSGEYLDTYYLEPLEPTLFGHRFSNFPHFAPMSSLTATYDRSRRTDRRHYVIQPRITWELLQVSPPQPGRNHILFAMSLEAIAALRRAVESMPNDVELRIHLAQLELNNGLFPEAIATLAKILELDPQHRGARELLTKAVTGSLPTAQADSTTNADSTTQADPTEPGDPSATGAVEPPPPASAPSVTQPQPTDPAPVFDWNAAEADLDSDVPPAFVDGSSQAPNDLFTNELPKLTLADVGGMEHVKSRLNASLLAPMRNPGLRALFGKTLRGGLLLYGPPGCGKTFLARAVAGELGAGFISVSIAEILDPFFGASEQRVHQLFLQAQRMAPCVIFIDELDTLGQRRGSANPMMAGVVNQLLMELDGFDGARDDVFTLAATNQPWQVDPALRRPGRFDRTVLVLPPDDKARESIFRFHLTDRPVEGIDVKALAARTNGFTGADIALICESASERALIDSVASGEARLIGMPDLLAALETIQPSIGPWLETARNYVQFGEDDGTFGELKSYLKRIKRL